jgi:excisionase family DNA binding protein
MNENKDKKEYFSTAELSHLLGVSRVAIFKKIKNGKIKAFKIGRNYVIPVEEFYTAIGTFISPEKKMEINDVVKKAVEEYGDTLRRLGKE